MYRTRTLFAMGLGAGLMYLLDPDKGNRRRALLRDRLIHWARVVPDAYRDRSEDLRNRLQGLFSEIGARLEPEHVDEGTLEARVRSKLGRVTSAPGAVYVTASGRKVTLSGSAPAEEVERIFAVVRSVRGVDSVDNQIVMREEWPEEQRGRPGGKRAA